MSKEQPKTNVSLQRTNFNHSKNGLIARPKSLPNKQSEQLHQRKVLAPTNNDTWFRQVWNVLYDGIVNVFGVNELRVPVDSINHNCYNWRKVTMSALDHPCPGYGVS